MEEAIDELEFLTASRSRTQLLRTLAADGRLPKADLHRRIDASRTTVGRHLNALEERGYIAYDPATNEYEATARGTAVAGELSAVLERMGIADRLGRFLERVPEGTLDLDVVHLAGAEIVHADPHDPYAPVNHHVEAVRAAASFRCLLPSTGLNQMREVTDSMDDRTNYTVVFEREILDAIRSDERYQRELTRMRESEGFEMAVYDGEIPYFLGIYDDVVQIGVEDAEGIPQALLESDSEAVREWAEETYASYRSESTSFD